MITKEQERKALEQIRKIVEGLGEGSYVATAFEGCFEIAEENINNDFACSMRQRAASAEKKAKSLELDNRDLRLAIGRVKEDASKKQTELEKQLAAVEKQLNRLDAMLSAATDMLLSPDLYKAIWTMAFDKAEEGKANILRSAGTMAEMADHPSDISFKAAVNIIKKNKQAVEDAEWIMAKLEDIKPAGC